MIETIKLKDLISQASKQNGCRIYDIYNHKDRLQILIDKEDPKKTGISVEDCENVFHSLQFLLSSELPQILEDHHLEISSPGIERRLRDNWHFEESIGKIIKFTTNSPIEVQNKQTGRHFKSQAFIAKLLSLKEENVQLKQDELEFSIPFSKIKSAHLVFSPNKNNLNPKTKNKNKNKKK